MNVTAVGMEQRVRLELDFEKQIAVRAAAETRATLTGKANALPFGDAARDGHVDGLACFAHFAAHIDGRVRQGQRTRIAGIGIGERDLDAHLTIVTAHLKAATRAAAAGTRTAAEN